MGASRLKRRQLSTLYVRVPRQDWPLVKRGHKTEFRMAGRYAATLDDCPKPTPVIAWCPVRYGPEPEQALMVLEAAWSERLGEIGPESLAREGFATRKEFVRYWKDRGHGGRTGVRAFKPLTQVHVYRLRPWRADEDLELLGVTLLSHLYGHILEAE